MRQNFDVRGGPQLGRQNLPKLRDAMKAQDLDGFYIPHEDEYQNEYLPACNDRLAWATGFTGSAGAAMVFQDTAVIFADGRYTLQVRDQTDRELIDVEGLPEPGPFGWLAKQTLSGKTVGYDPRLMTPNDLDTLTAAAKKSGADLKAVETNPIDQAWDDRPGEPMAKVVAQKIKFAGLDSTDKRQTIADALKEDGADAAIITSPASVAWAFNIRGGDVACSPLPLARAILNNDGSADLFLDPRKVTDELRQHLGNTVTVRAIDELEPAIATLKNKTVSLDPALASAWFFKQVEDAGANILKQRDPVLLPKACKNSTEISGTEAAHIRDGAALTRFLHWLDTEAQSGDITEIDAALKLESFRDELSELNDLSFETISGAGPHGALPHYRVSSASNLELERGSLYLVDSGGQYLDGTTDVTRTVPIGGASDDMKRHYTLVLQGHIALATVRFPEGTTGTHLDALARYPLWQAGLDYDHGTGHGVGVYLGVHEGPQRIAKPWNSVALRPGMIVSNEPGYYREGQYGIRIENLQYVTEPADIPAGERKMLGFANLTWAPLARDLIMTSMLSPAEHDWVDQYHRDVLERIGPLVETEVADWLRAACAPL
ncbi:MAG: aminopeptidase P family protein [Henriciella sp.]|uniref:aminopeptidase P family protein n=1 Tax=Henriciella sp. TaxID=1968823 RepID=UPI003C775A24